PIAIRGIDIRDACLVPRKPGRHRKKMTQCNSIFFRRSQIVVFGEEREDPGVEIGKQSPVERDANEQRGRAFADRTDVVLCPRVEVHLAEREAETPVLPGKIVLVDQCSVAGDDDSVSLRLLRRFEARADATDQCGIETYLLW